MNMDEFMQEQEDKRSKTIAEAEQRALFVKSLMRVYEKRIDGAIETAKMGFHPGKMRPGECSYQLHEHAKMLRREVLELDKLILKL